MTFRFDSDAHPQRLARSLHRLLAETGHAGPLARSRDLLARMLGHRGWDVLLADCAARPVPSPHDHAVDVPERRARRERCLAALADAGLPPDRAVAVLSHLAPTARRGSPGLPAPDPAALALAAAPGWGEVLESLHAVAVEDPFFADRGSRSAHGAPAPATRNLLADLRGDPGHPAWPAMLLALVRHVGEGDPDLAARIAADEPRAALLALRSHGVAAALSRFERFAGRYAAALLPAGDPPALPWPPAGSARTPWHAAPLPGVPPAPTGWEARHTGHLAALNLLVSDVPETVHVRILPESAPEWLAFRGNAGRSGKGPPGTAVLLRPAGAAGPTQGLVARMAADMAAGVIHVDIEGPFEGSPPPEPDASPYLAHAVASWVLADLRSWSRHVRPGGTLRLAVSPEPAPGADPFPQDVVDAVAETFALCEGEGGDLGFDLVASRARRDGTPVRMPALHRTRCPEAHLSDWKLLAEAVAEARLAAGEPLVLLDQGGGPELSDVEGRPVEFEGAARILGSEGSRAALSATLAEAGLGPDAIALAGEGYVAIVSDEAWERDDWSQDRAIALVLDGPDPGEGAWERMRAAFWRDNHDRYDAILRAQAERGEAPGRAHAPGTRTLQ